NLFDKRKVKSGYIRPENGSVGLTPINSYSDYIKVRPNTTYYINQSQFSNSAGFAFYDKDKNYIAGELLKNQNVIVTPDCTKDIYIRVTIKNDDIDTFQLEKGNTATEYEPYKESTAYVVAKDKDNKIVNLKRI